MIDHMAFLFMETVAITVIGIVFKPDRIIKIIICHILHPDLIRVLLKNS